MNPLDPRPGPIAWCHMNRADHFCDTCAEMVARALLALTTTMLTIGAALR